MNRSNQIIELIEKNPGIKFREIMRETGMNIGVIAYYTHKLEKEGTVKVDRKPRQTRFFPVGIDENDFHLIKNLRQETPKQIISALLKHEFLSFNELVQNVKKSPATVSFYLTQLTNEGIVDSKFINLKRHHFVKEIGKLRDIVDKYHPSLIERSADYLADTFSSL